MVLSESYEALSFLLDNIFIQCGAKLYQQIVGIRVQIVPSLIVDLPLFCYKRNIFVRPLICLIFLIDLY